jgi:hypothetical protein
MLQFDHERRPDFELVRLDFRAHYENVAAHKSLSILLSIRRHWRLIASVVTLALALGVRHVAAAAASFTQAWMRFRCAPSNGPKHAGTFHERQTFHRQGIMDAPGASTRAAGRAAVT